MVHFRFPGIQFLTPISRSHYLVLFGIVLTVFGHSLEKYENSERLSGRPPTAEITTRLLTYRQLPPKDTEKVIKLNSFLFELRNMKTFEIFAKTLFSFKFGISFKF